MFHTETYASSSTATPFQFDTSSIQGNLSQEKHISAKSTTGSHATNFNRNANYVSENFIKKYKSLHRLVQSLHDITRNDLYSTLDQESTRRDNKPRRVESALITYNEYSHCLVYSLIHESGPRVDMGMNRTIGSIQRNGAGDENAFPHFNNKQVNTSTIKENNHYLTLEHVRAHNQQTTQRTSKQLILFSVSMLFFTILLCLVMIFFIF